MKTKVLVCGSTGFLMANFIRYLLYRSKDFEIVSIDNLDDLSDLKRLYFNKNNKFYIGDASDKKFLYKLIHLENPDFIVYGNESWDHNIIIESVFNLLELKKDLVFILPFGKDNDEYNICNYIENIIDKNNQTIIELPNKFGMRQSPNLLGGNLALLIKSCLSGIFNADTQKVPWVYAEDVSSFLWFVIENRLKGIIKMPALGYLSERDLIEKIISIFGIKDYEIQEYICKGKLIQNYNCSNIKDWVPDSENINISLEKTIKWYNINKWAIQ